MSSPSPFDVFLQEENRIRDEEWALARKYLIENNPGNHLKLPRANKNPDSQIHKRSFIDRIIERYEVEAVLELQPLKHSFININGKLLALLPHTAGVDAARGQDPAIAGAGNYGKVKYAVDQEGREYVVKIEHKGVEPAQDDEISVMQEMGWEADSASRRLEDGSEQRYTIMPYLGEPLSKKIKSPRVVQQDPQNLDIAIKLAWQVHSLHQGWLSGKGNPVAHHDIKAPNVLVDKDKKIHLVDWGLAKRNVNIDERCNGSAGSPRFLPNDPETYSHRQLDVIALQRTIYQPRAYCAHNRDDRSLKDYQRQEEDYCLLTDHFVREHNLEGTYASDQNVVGTARPNPVIPGARASFISASLALASLNLREETRLKNKIFATPNADEAIVTLYFAGVLDEKKDELDTILDNSDLIKRLASFAPFIEKLDSADANRLITLCLSNPHEAENLIGFMALQDACSNELEIKDEFLDLVSECSKNKVQPEFENVSNSSGDVGFIQESSKESRLTFDEASQDEVDDFLTCSTEVNSRSSFASLQEDNEGGQSLSVETTDNSQNREEGGLFEKAVSFKPTVYKKLDTLSFTLVMKLLEQDEHFFDQMSKGDFEQAIKSIILKEAASEKYTGLAKRSAQCDGIRQLSNLSKESPIESFDSVLSSKQRTEYSPRLWQKASRRDPVVQDFYTKAHTLIQKAELLQSEELHRPSSNTTLQ